jgi:hypothetical protein
MSNVRLFSRVFAGFATLALMVGCGSSAPPAVSVAVAPTTATLVAGATQTFTATVTNDSTATPGVTWTASAGAITAGGVYTAPTPVPATSATITATSKTDTTKTATAAVSFTPIAVSITTTPVAMVAGATQTFAATVTGDATANAGVTWTASVGAITAAGVYTAPTPVTTATATITATSKTDTTKSNTATVTLTPIAVSITTTPVAMVAGATQTFAATVTGDATANAGVTWTASVGAITAAGVYTAPTPVTTATATITATSKTDTTKSNTATVTLTPIVVTIPTTPTAIPGAGTEAITATVTGDQTLNAGVTWSITSGGGTLSAVTITSVTYTAPLPVTTANAVITATSKTDTTKTTTITIPLTPISVGAITPATVNLGTTSTQNFTGAAVSNDSSNSGVTWSISPATGAGTIVAATGVYSAPATVISTLTTVTVTATSVKDNSKTATATITLNPIAIAAISPLTATLNGGGTQAFTGAALTYDGSNSGVTWSISPASGAGTIVAATGAYTAPAVVAGTSPVTVTVTATSVKDNTKSTTATITLNPISVSFTTVTTGITLDSGQTLALAAAITNDSSASGATFATTGAGSVAPGSATGNTPGTTLTATGSTASAVTVTATSIKDNTKTATTASVTVNPALAITTAAGALTAGTTNTAYPGATIAASGGTGSKTFAIASGALPGGLSISASGAISGTITGGAATYTFTVKVTDSATTPTTAVSGSYTITVSATPLVFTTPSAPVTLPTATVGTAIAAYTLATSGGTGAISYSVNSGTLPAGLSIVGNQIVGTPTAPTAVAGTVVTIKATDSATPTPATLVSPNITIIVNPVLLVVNLPTLPVGTIGAAYNTSGYQFTSTGGTGAITWTLSPTTVDGLTLSTSGLLSGTPTATYGPATISVTATDSATNQQQTKNITPSLTVNNALAITTLQSSLPNAYTSQSYNTTLAAAGGSGTGYTWTVTSGLSTLTAINLAVSTGGVITGTPAATGTATFTVQVTDSASHTATANYIIQAYAPLTLTTPSSSVPGPGYVNAAYTASIAALGGVVPYTYAVNGSTLAANGSVSLGDGLSITNNATGTVLNITGTPTAVNSGITFTVKVTDSASNSVGPSTYTIVVTNQLTVTTLPSSLPNAYVNQAYPSTTLAAAGGSSSGYTWSVTSGLTGANSLATLNLAVSAGGVITGTPAATGTANFTVKVTDSSSNTATQTYSITAYTPLSLPTPNPTSLPAATTSSSYTGAINATGGVGPTYTWTVNSSNANSGAVNLGNGTMQAASSGGNTLNITGQPSTAGTITLNVTVKDSAGTTVGPTAYTIAVTTNYSVGGSINLNNGCGGTLPTYAVTLSNSGGTVGTTNTNSSGNFSFLNIPNGTYTITPSITGPSSVFYPATLSVTVNNANISTANFGVALGYTVSGTASYSGSVSQANPIYLSLSSNCNFGNGNPGTSLSAAGTYTVHGVPPGTYTLSAFQDNLGYGSQNASNPVGSTSGVALTTTNVTGANVTLSNPSTVTLTTAPTLQGVAGLNNGVFAQYKAITNSNSIETPTSYTMQWSTTSAFTAVAGSRTFPATGGGGANIWFVNSAMTTGCTNCSTLTNGSVFYFRAFATSAGTPTSSFSSVFGPVTIGAPTGGVAVSGAITYPGTATGPLYVGFYNYSTGNLYGQYIASPTSAQAYTISVPVASTYYFVAVLDNNNNGVVDAGDLTDVNNSGNPPLANITGATTNENLTLLGGNSILSTYTGHLIQTGQSDTYQVNANVRTGIKLPVAVELISATNPDVIVPQDIAACTSCGNPQFQLQASTQTIVPVVNDSYGLKVTYSDGTSDAALPATVSTVLTSSAAATALSPTTGTSTSTQPTFSWTYPASASSYTYQFWIYQPSGGNVWQIPGNDSNAKGFTSSQVPVPAGIAWITSGNDILGESNNLPTQSSLSTSTTYNWTIQTIDTNGNYVQNSVNYQP